MPDLDWKQILHDALANTVSGLIILAVASGALGVAGQWLLQGGVTVPGWLVLPLAGLFGLLVCAAWPRIMDWISGEEDQDQQAPKGQQLRERGIDRLHHLTPPEKKILRGYIEGQTRTQQLNIMDGNVKKLVSVGIIRQASNLGTVPGGFAFNIREWAWDYLHQNPELLEPKLRGPLPKERY